MARDGVLPKQLSYLSKKYHTPFVATIFVGIIIAPISIFCSLELISTMVSFGALFGFILLNSAVIFKFFIQNRKGRKQQKYQAFVQYLICPLIGLMVTLWIFMNPGINAHLVGFLWLLSGVLYLVCITRFFTSPVPHLDMT